MRLWSKLAHSVVKHNSEQSSPNKETQKQKKSLKEKPQVENWAGLFSQNRNAANGMALTYVAPMIIDGKTTVTLE